MSILNNNMYAGFLGYYGYKAVDIDYNKKVDQANKLVDDYNNSVVNIKTSDQFKFQREILSKIEKLLN